MHLPCAGYFAKHQYEKVIILYLQEIQSGGGESCNTVMDVRGALIEQTGIIRRRFYRRNSTWKLIVIHMSLILWSIARSLMGRAQEEVGGDSKCGKKVSWD